jgi:hypothetical protein
MTTETDQKLSSRGQGVDDDVLLEAIAEYRLSQPKLKGVGVDQSQEVVWEKLKKRLPIKKPRERLFVQPTKTFAYASAITILIVVGILFYPVIDRPEIYQADKSNNLKQTVSPLLMEFVVSFPMSPKQSSIRGQANMRVSAGAALSLTYTSPQAGFFYLVRIGKEDPVSSELLYPPIERQYEQMTSQPHPPGTHGLVLDRKPMAISLNGLSGKQTLVGLVSQKPISDTQLILKIAANYNQDPRSDILSDILAIGIIPLQVTRSKNHATE